MTLRSVFSLLAKATSALPDVAHVAEETSAREVNRMLAHGWQLLLVVAASDGQGTYPVYIMGQPRQGSEQPAPAAAPV